MHLHGHALLMQRNLSLYNVIRIERRLEGWVVKFVSLEEYFFHEVAYCVPLSLEREKVLGPK